MLLIILEWSSQLFESIDLDFINFETRFVRRSRQTCFLRISLKPEESGGHFDERCTNISEGLDHDDTSLISFQN